MSMICRQTLITEVSMNRSGEMTLGQLPSRYVLYRKSGAEHTCNWCCCQCQTCTYLHRLPLCFPVALLDFHLLGFNTRTCLAGYLDIYELWRHWEISTIGDWYHSYTGLPWSCDIWWVAVTANFARDIDVHVSVTILEIYGMNHWLTKGSVGRDRGSQVLDTTAPNRLHLYHQWNFGWPDHMEKGELCLIASYYICNSFAVSAFGAIWIRLRCDYLLRLNGCAYSWQL